MKNINIFILIFGLLLAISCSSQYKPVSYKYQMITVNEQNSTQTDSSIIKIIEPYKSQIDKEMMQVIAHSNDEITKDIPEGKLNNLIADIIFTKAEKYFVPASNLKVDFCLLNHGGLRKSLPKGEITIGNVFELMPFDNKIIIIMLSGEDTYHLFSFLSEKNEGHPIANCQLVSENKKPKSILVNNQPFDINKKYCIATNDYLSYGNDGMYFFKNPIKIFETNYLIRDLIIEYLKEQKLPLSPSIDGRYIFRN